MNAPNNYESRLWRLLEKEQLADLSQYHQRGFADEVPLYSRESDIDFLPVRKDAANEILVRFALKFLKSVIAYEEHRTGFFAAITVWNLAPGPVIPNLFVWCGGVRGLEDKLALNTVTTPFGMRIKKLLQRSHMGKGFEVLEDHATIPEATRVFIGPAQPPYLGFADLLRLRRATDPSKRRRLRA